jgi:hypothetical protein
MTEKFLETLKGIADENFITYLQTRLEEALRYGDRSSAEIVGKELINQLENIDKTELEEELVEKINKEIEAVKEALNTEREDLGGTYLLSDELIESLEEAYGEGEDVEWQFYITARLAEASDVQDYPNVIFLTGKYFKELSYVYEDEPEIMEGLNKYPQIIEEYKKETGDEAPTYQTVAEYMFEHPEFIEE